MELELEPELELELVATISRLRETVETLEFFIGRLRIGARLAETFPAIFHSYVEVSTSSWSKSCYLIGISIIG